MTTKEGSGPKKMSKPNQPKRNKAFESSLRLYPSPLLNAKQSSVDTSTMPSDSDLNFTLYNWKGSDTPSSSNKGCWSTPTANCAAPACDASAIVADQSCLPTFKQPFGVKNKAKLNFSRAKTESVLMTNRKPMLVLPEDSRKQEKIEEDLASAEINLLYCEYVQAAYLESKAKKTLAERDRNATESLYKIWAANQILMEEEKTLKAELEAIQCLDQMIEYCEKEKSMLEPIVAVLPNIMTQYKEISEAADTLRHKLHAPGVLIPADAGFETEIKELIKEVKDNLNILHCFYNSGDQFGEIADVLAAIERVLGEMTLVIMRCQKLLSKADSLTITETSLKIGEINLNKI